MVPGVTDSDVGTPREDSPAVQELRNHLVNRGAYINDAIVCADIHIADGVSYRGVKTVRDLKKDEVLVSIPESLLLSVRSAKRDPDIHQAIRGAAPNAMRDQLSDQQLLAVRACPFPALCSVFFIVDLLEISDR